MDTNTFTASLERSLQNFSINDQHHQNSSAGNIIRSSVSGSSSTEIVDPSNRSSIELHSETPLPYFWEQCLDLKTGGIYYINWRSGMRSEEDPRTNPEIINTEYYNSEDDSCSDDSEGYSSSYSDHSSPPSVVSNEKDLCIGMGVAEGDDEEQVLVVTGCKNCFMYFMVPKEVEECPKCCGQLLHFDR